MKLLKKTGLSIIFSLALCTIQAEESGIFFNGTVEAAREKAKAENKLYFIEFYAKWCEPCKWMDEHTWSHPNLTGYISKNYVPIKVDVENLDGFVWKQKYKVQYLPTIVVLDVNGNIMGKYEKSLGPSDLLRILQQHKSMPNENIETQPLAEAMPVITNQSNDDAKPMFVSVKREPGLPKASEIVKKPITVASPNTNPGTLVRTTIPSESPVALSTPVAKAKKPAKTGDPSLEEAYRVQVGVFSDAVNVTNEINKLKKSYPNVQVFNKKNTETNVVTYRITLGKFQTKEEAASFAQTLKSKGLSGIVKHSNELK